MPCDCRNNINSVMYEMEMDCDNDMIVCDDLTVEGNAIVSSTPTQVPSSELSSSSSIKGSLQRVSSDTFESQNLFDGFARGYYIDNGVQKQFEIKKLSIDIDGNVSGYTVDGHGSFCVQGSSNCLYYIVN